jgi:hypothetical protein
MILHLFALQAWGPRTHDVLYLSHFWYQIIAALVCVQIFFQLFEEENNDCVGDRVSDLVPHGFDSICAPAPTSECGSDPWKICAES